MQNILLFDVIMGESISLTTFKIMLCHLRLILAQIFDECDLMHGFAVLLIALDDHNIM